ncbi:hypothetical protein KR200_007198, partial [Drosophila serrata]
KNPIGQLLISFGLGYFVTTKISQIYTKFLGNSSEFQTNGLKDKKDIQLLPTEREVLLLTIKQLAAFNGMNPDQPVYTALNGNIYDLSPCREKFSKQGLFSHLAGCDANEVLRTAYYAMGVCADDLINRWEQSLMAEFNIVGYLIDQDMESNSESAEMRDKSIINNSITKDDLG